MQPPYVGASVTRSAPETTPSWSVRWGRLVQEKGYTELFEAWEVLRRAHPAAMLVIAGPTDAAKADALPEGTIETAQHSGVRFLGMRDDVEDLYLGFDLYVLASHREGFPRSAMEAAASGLPIVATDIRGCRQVVDHDRNGLLVPVRSARALEAAIARLVGDAGLRQDMAEAAVTKAREDFDQQRVIERTLATYARLLVATGTTPPQPVSS
ncbi:MAG: glycosyltransferase [Microthrixaceae bacterium]|nr:glycosyltransferase [Microthrixaceae bacterium]